MKKNKMIWYDGQGPAFPKPNQEVLVMHSYNHGISNSTFIYTSDGEYFWDDKIDTVLQPSEVDFWTPLERP